jgi:hypothetical protein
MPNRRESIRDLSMGAVGYPWANRSNTPFRLFKHWTHEDRVATPLVVHWPHGRFPAPGRACLTGDGLLVARVLPPPSRATRAE